MGSEMCIRDSLLTPKEQEALTEGLERVRREFAEGAFAIEPDDEDIHSAIERRLTELVGLSLIHI